MIFKVLLRLLCMVSQLAKDHVHVAGTVELMPLRNVSVFKKSQQKKQGEKNNA